MFVGRVFRLVRAKLPVERLQVGLGGQVAGVRRAIKPPQVLLRCSSRKESFPFGVLSAGRRRQLGTGPGRRRSRGEIKQERVDGEGKIACHS